VSIILTSIKIATNVIGFLMSYVSRDAGYIPGILTGVGLMFVSIIIPEKQR